VETLFEQCSNPYFITKDLKEKKRSTDQPHELASGTRWIQPGFTYPDLLQNGAELVKLMRTKSRYFPVVL